jgi:hypothetical protein
MVSKRAVPFAASPCDAATGPFASQSERRLFEVFNTTSRRIRPQTLGTAEKQCGAFCRHLFVEATNLMSKRASIFLWCLLGQHCFAQYSPDSIRVAHIEWAGKDKPIPQQFLLSAKKNAYNYVMCEYVPFANEWNDSGKIVGVHPTAFEKRLAQHFGQVDSAGLRLIPLLQTANRYADYYHYAINSLIPQQLIHQNLQGATKADHASFVMAPESNATGANLMNEAFDSVWTMVFNAFINARPRMKYKTLSFVHLGGDENYYSWLDRNVPAYEMVLLAGLCGPDTEWIAMHGLRDSSTEIQVQRLYAASLKSRVDHISSLARRFGFSTKTMVWGDMFDPFLNGGNPYLYSFRNLFDPKLQRNDPFFNVKDNLIRIRLVGALRQPDLQAVRDKLVLCPWVYDTLTPVGRYVPKNVIDTFTSCGYKVVYCCSSGTTFGFDSFNRPQYNPGTEAAIANAHEFAVAAHDKRFAAKCIGYVSASWSDIASVDSRQGNLLWKADSNYIRPFGFLEILAKINYQLSSFGQAIGR